MKKFSLGFMLMECLIAFSLISTLFFSLMLYQINNTLHAQSILYELIASTQLMNVLEILQKKQNITRWKQTAKTLLPHMQYHSDTAGFHLCHVAITWFYRHTYHRQLMGYC